MAADGKHGGPKRDLPGQVHHTWRTPMAADSDSGKRIGLDRQVRAWPTPTSSLRTTGDLEQARYAGNDPRRPSYADAQAEAEATESVMSYIVRGEVSFEEMTDDFSMPYKMFIPRPDQKMWPTPSAGGSAGEISEDLERDGAKLKNKKTGRILQTNLATEVKWEEREKFPTPMAKDGRRGVPDPDNKRNGLPGAVNQFPTPQARDWRTGNGDRTDRSRLEGVRGRTDLPDVVAAEEGFGLTEASESGQGEMFAFNDPPRASWGTPRASDSKGSGPAGSEIQKDHAEKGYLDGQVKDEEQKFPTPTSSDFKGRGKGSIERHAGLDNFVKNFPTPRSSDAERGVSDKGREGGPNLPTAVSRTQWPTPRGGSEGVGMCGGTGAFEKMQEIQDEGVITDEERRQMIAGGGGQLAPNWVEILMGWPAGWTAVDDIAAAWLNVLAKAEGRRPKFEGEAVLGIRIENRTSLDAFLDAWHPEWETGVPRVARGVANRVDRLRAVGNGVVPQQAFYAWIILLWLAGIEPMWDESCAEST